MVAPKSRPLRKVFRTDTAPKIDTHGLVPTGCLEAPTSASNGLRIASLTDILKQKLAAMAVREVKRDGEDVAAILEHGKANVRLAIAALRDETGIGLGADESERLALLISDLSHTVWQNFPTLSTLVPQLLSKSAVPLTLACDRIEGPSLLQVAREAPSRGISQ